MKEVRIGMFPGELKSFVLEEGTTVGQALSLAGITLNEETEVRVDGVATNVSDVVSGLTVLVTKKTKGN